MSKWPGKYVIGLTGNIATGKSVVRKMLEHLGAYTIDADTLSHRAIAKGAPGYKPVVNSFGKFILDANEEIDRAKLGRLAFNNPDVLKVLETIIHPLVEGAIDLMVRRAGQRIIVIEAIKLLEGKFFKSCDAIWVTYSPESLQLARLMQKRGMKEQEALQRIRVQPSQESKISAANVVIKNIGSFEDTWKQVVAAWKGFSVVPEITPVAVQRTGIGELAVLRGRPRDSSDIARLITRLSGGTRRITSDDVMAAFGDKAFLLLLADKHLVGLAGWQVENLVARTSDFFFDSGIRISLALKTMVTEVEQASQDLQCEASLVFSPPKLSMQEDIWKELGYSRRTPQTLGVRAWQDAALESQPLNTVLYFKQLRKDRILRPI